MRDLEQRVKALESKVKLLEETLETLKNMSLSEQMGSYIQTRGRSLKMIDLVNSIDSDSHLDFDKERETLEAVRAKKATVDARISQAIRNAGTFSDDFPDDPRYFNYEVETGMTTDRWSDQNKIPALNQFVGEGLRITAYNGFETKRIIIPREINGRPVTSIGDKAFMNATFSEVILPKSIKAILHQAFSGCKNLKQVDLPEALEYMGSYCFAGSGLRKLAFPDSLKNIPCGCCDGCGYLETISIGHQVKKIGYSAFKGCSEIRSVTLPESLSEIEFRAFGETAITTIIFPSNMSKVSGEIFANGYRRYLKRKITCVFLGKDTTTDGRLANVSLIYCLPGSKIQQMAREYSIPIKPLSEFRMEDDR